MWAQRARKKSRKFCPIFVPIGVFGHFGTNQQELKDKDLRDFLTQKLGNAEGGTRTPTGCPIRPSNVRVYQFHHFGIGRRDYQTCRYFFAGEAVGEALATGDAAGLALVAGVALATGVAEGTAAGAGIDAGAAPPLTTVLTPNPGSENRSAKNMNIPASTAVAFSSGFCGPRGPKAD